MFFELIGTILAGVATALLFWAVNRALKGRLPAWLMPVSAGLAMLIATISSEYGWYERTTRTMPQGFVVAQTIEETAIYRPWTYLVPYVSRFVAVNRASLRTHPDHAGQRIADLVFYGRWTRTARVPMLFDCDKNRRADLVDGGEFGPDGGIIGADWVALAASDPVLRTACAEV